MKERSGERRHGPVPEEKERDVLLETAGTGGGYRFSLSFIFVALSMAVFVTYAASVVVNPFLPEILQKEGMSSGAIGSLFCVFSFASAAMSAISGALIRRLGDETCLSLALCITGLCNLIFAYQPRDVLLFLVLNRAVQGCMNAVVLASAYLVITKVLGGDAAFGIGVLETVIGLGCCTGDFLGGFLYSNFGFESPFLALTMAAVVAAACCVVLLSKLPCTTRSLSESGGSEEEGGSGGNDSGLDGEREDMELDGHSREEDFVCESLTGVSVSLNRNMNMRKEASVLERGTEGQGKGEMPGAAREEGSVRSQKGSACAWSRSTEGEGKGAAGEFEGTLWVSRGEQGETLDRREETGVSLRGKKGREREQDTEGAGGSLVSVRVKGKAGEEETGADTASEEGESEIEVAFVTLTELLSSVRGALIVLTAFMAGTIGTFFAPVLGPYVEDVLGPVTQTVVGSVFALMDSTYMVACLLAGWVVSRLTKTRESVTQNASDGSSFFDGSHETECERDEEAEVERSQTAFACVAGFGIVMSAVGFQLVVPSLPTVLFVGRGDSKRGAWGCLLSGVLLAGFGQGCAYVPTVAWMQKVARRMWLEKCAAVSEESVATEASTTDESFVNSEAGSNSSVGGGEEGEEGSEDTDEEEEEEEEESVEASPEAVSLVVGAVSLGEALAPFLSSTLVAQLGFETAAFWFSFAYFATALLSLVAFVCVNDYTGSGPLDQHMRRARAVREEGLPLPATLAASRSRAAAAAAVRQGLLRAGFPGDSRSLSLQLGGLAGRFDTQSLDGLAVDRHSAIEIRRYLLHRSGSGERFHAPAPSLASLSGYPMAHRLLSRSLSVSSVVGLGARSGAGSARSFQHRAIPPRTRFREWRATQTGTSRSRGGARKGCAPLPYRPPSLEPPLFSGGARHSPESSDDLKESSAEEADESEYSETNHMSAVED
uniref:Major facilitator superfamily (MFS) profile domain-containing protein n=1 Tax=Chromera velia CCMP2878 TaxID=1169474 RepID=A0A0G4FSL3_9ALVE|eukprot:Cvel_18568.t1-p1 / transcript=Cvel_18568.t1 / gene=Cvel_18568 / organism=Chromera_velia_CCMP2878 / gene_product=MFS-type transporter SLC18B1, putative / transcript_product=MFS-type transporter SLC18B1, putative / location=Cvel_scaffold1547:35405-41652(-) / protein_length=943 / sequence_SO=supercontig / SO=protein_coding / is_pseudo=false